MSIEVIETVHEYLTRFADDGSVQGQHIVLRRIVRDTLTGEVISDTPTAPIPVGSAKGMMPLETAIGKVSAALAVAEEVARAKQRQAERERNAAIEQRDSAFAERNAAVNERDAAILRAEEATADKQARDISP